MTHDNPNLPLGGHTSYGPTRPTEAEQRTAICDRYGFPPQLVECGCCGAWHPSGFLGDCRQDMFRVSDPDAVFPDGWADVSVEVL